MQVKVILTGRVVLLLSGFAIALTFVLILSSCSDWYSSPGPIKNTPTVYIVQGAQDLYPAFSPDGNRIAYFHGADTTKSYPPGLYVIDRDGTNRKLVLAGIHIDPSWSPDSEWLVFSSQGILQKCKINGDSLSTFTTLNGSLKYPNFYFPDWSKDGKYIYFDNPFVSDGGGIFKTNTAFSQAKRLFKSTQFGRNPRLSPAGNAILFFDWITGHDRSEIFVSDTLGNSVIQLTNNTRDDKSPVWSPNGNEIAWSSDVRISVMNADGTSQKEITFGNSPSWSVNNQIVFSYANSDFTKEVLYTISTDGSNRKQITF